MQGITMATPQNHLAVIKVVGVGGGGVNAVNRMIEVSPRMLSRSILTQALLMSDAETKLGTRRANWTHGLRAVARILPSVARPRITLTQIAAALEGADMVFVTAGEGGGTGRCAPVVARVASRGRRADRGSCDRPFSFEGNAARRRPETTLREE